MIKYPEPLPEYDPSKPADPINPTKPRDNPLGNPLIYHAKTQAANDYRELMFDTPEEVQDAVQYQAHMDTRAMIEDGLTVEPAWAGQKMTTESKHKVPENLPLIDYLVRADYYGNTVFAGNTTLGGTTFTVKMLVDSLSQPEVTMGTNPTFTQEEVKYTKPTLPVFDPKDYIRPLDPTTQRAIASGQVITEPLDEEMSGTPGESSTGVTSTTTAAPAGGGTAAPRPLVLVAPSNEYPNSNSLDDPFVYQSQVTNDPDQTTDSDIDDFVEDIIN